MKIKKEDPSKVIIIPRPPRSNNQAPVPIQPHEDLEAIDPEAGSLGPQTIPTENPFGTLAGPAAPLSDVESQEEEAEEE